MAQQQRVYIVTEEGNERVRLVRASTPAQAIRHVVKSVFSANVASQDALIDALGKGETVENAAEDASE